MAGLTVERGERTWEPIFEKRRERRGVGNKRHNHGQEGDCVGNTKAGCNKEDLLRLQSQMSREATTSGRAQAGSEVTRVSKDKKSKTSRESKHTPTFRGEPSPDKGDGGDRVRKDKEE